MKRTIAKEYAQATIIFIIVSLKGGVAKSTTSASISYYLAKKSKVGLWDMDITSPSIAKILNMQGRELTFTKGGKLAPIDYSENLSVMSVDFFLPSSDQPIVFNEKKKKSHMMQFLKSVDFGKCDYFVFDTPPTTSPELLTILNLFPAKNIRIVILSQPGDASSNSAMKSIQHLKSTGLPISGIVCTMDGHTCKKCGHYDPIFPNPVSIEDMAEKYGISYLGNIELGTVKSTDDGAMIYDHDKFRSTLNKIISTKPKRFKPMDTSISFFKKAIMVQTMDKNINALLKKKKKKVKKRR